MLFKCLQFAVETNVEATKLMFPGLRKTESSFLLLNTYPKLCAQVSDYRAIRLAWRMILVVSETIFSSQVGGDIKFFAVKNGIVNCIKSSLINNHYYQLNAVFFRHHTRYHFPRHKKNLVKNSLTIGDPISSHVEPESSIAPVESFRNYLIHHRHIKIDGIVQKQRVNWTLLQQCTLCNYMHCLICIRTIAMQKKSKTTAFHKCGTKSAVTAVWATLHFHPFIFLNIID